jgi:ATP-binding protein involved in chromosome partitioning
MTNIDGKDMIIPIEKFGIKLMSIGFLVDEKSAVVWRGPMASSAIRQFVNDVDWEELDYLVIDMPPGTGDIHLTLVQTVPVTGAIIVTTPQSVSVLDARRTIDFSKQLKMPLLGLLENMAGYLNPTDGTLLPLFGQGGGKQACEELDVTFLGSIAMDPRAVDLCEAGKAILEGETSLKPAYEALLNHIEAAMPC